MRILFDKNVPAKLRRSLSGHQVETAAQRALGQLSNGVLIQAAEIDGFELMVSCDQNIRYQQNLSKRRISLIILRSNRWQFVQKHLPEIIAAIDNAIPNSYTFIKMPLPSKPKYNP